MPTTTPQVIDVSPLVNRAIAGVLRGIHDDVSALLAVHTAVLNNPDAMEYQHDEAAGAVRALKMVLPMLLVGPPDEAPPT